MTKTRRPPAARPEFEAEFTAEEIARRRDEAIKRMIATAPKRHKDEPKRRDKGGKKIYKP
jgi:hypothetical protein